MDTINGVLFAFDIGKDKLAYFRDIGQNVLMANPNQQMFYSPYGDHSIQ